MRVHCWPEAGEDRVGEFVGDRHAAGVAAERVTATMLLLPISARRGWVLTAGAAGRETARPPGMEPVKTDGGDLGWVTSAAARREVALVLVEQMGEPERRLGVGRRRVPLRGQSSDRVVGDLGKPVGPCPGEPGAPSR